MLVCSVSLKDFFTVVILHDFIYATIDMTLSTLKYFMFSFTQNVIAAWKDSTTIHRYLVTLNASLILMGCTVFFHGQIANKIFWI